ncbi:MAG: N-acetylglucosamine-6-phosphate deacetylase [Spirochaetes bacterium]|nr:N-acetylglucosamine-6-phosphate deacetylase [Spirochaetota bacterium]
MTLPGFVDLQVNGYLNIDFSSDSLTTASFMEACNALFEAGTAAFLPTIITSPAGLYERNLAIIADVMKRDAYRGRVLGVHLEGPFISKEPGAVGAHNPAYVIKPDTAMLSRWQTISGGAVKLITIAAEAEGSEAFTRFAVANGVAVSLGHQLATYADMKRLAAAGARASTHVGNGVPNMLPRHENPIWAAAACDGLSAMLITDGHHLPPQVITTIVRAKCILGTIITSDASPLAGMPPGEYQTLGNRAVLEPGGRLHNPDKQCLVGSSAVMLACANHLNTLSIVSPKDIVTMGLHNPLALIGMRTSDIAPHKHIRVTYRNGAFAVVKK